MGLTTRDCSFASRSMAVRIVLRDFSMSFSVLLLDAEAEKRADA